MLPVDYGPATDPHAGPGVPVVESAWIEPYPDETLGVEDGFAAPEARYEQRESIELAFIAALQHLPARQRAVLILREVLGFSAKEVGEALDTTVASVNSALQRARATIDEKLPDPSQQETLRAIDDDELQQIVETYVDAWERNDVEAVVAMLAEDAAIAMPPLASWFGPRDVFADFLVRWPMSGEWRWKARPDARQRPARARLLPVGRGARSLRAVRAQRARLPRQADQGRHRVRGPHARRARRGRLPSLGGAAPGRAAARVGLRPLRPAAPSL